MKEGDCIDDFKKLYSHPNAITYHNEPVILERASILRYVVKPGGWLDDFAEFFRSPLVQYVFRRQWHDVYIHLFTVQYRKYRKIPCFYAWDTTLDYPQDQRVQVFEFLLPHIDRRGVEQMWTKTTTMLWDKKYWYLLFHQKYHIRCYWEGEVAKIYQEALILWNEQKNVAFALFLCIYKRYGSKDMARLTAEMVMKQKWM